MYASLFDLAMLNALIFETVGADAPHPLQWGQKDHAFTDQVLVARKLNMGKGFRETPAEPDALSSAWAS